MLRFDSAGLAGVLDIIEAGLEVIHLLSRYSNPPHREMLIDPALFGYLRSDCQTEFLNTAGVQAPPD
jgi:hypothetical protein